LFDSPGQFRRPIAANWDPEESPPTSLAVADFFTAGHARLDGSDIRVTTDDGTPVASHVLVMGPGDRARIVFTLQRPIKNYWVYFGGPKPASTQPATGAVKFDCGLHMEIKQLAGRRVRAVDDIQDAWERSGNVIGETMIPEASLGFNPLGPMDHTIARISGSLFAPIDGDYIFSVFAQDFAALYLDGKPVLLASRGPADTRTRATVQLTRGPHEFVIYHVSIGGDGIFLVAWQPPGAGAFATVGRGQFAPFHTSEAGAMQQAGSPLTADFAVQYIAESFFADGYAHHYRFSAHQFDSDRAQYNWDLGDGQIANGTDFDHVYLADRIYPVKLTVRVGSNVDTQTIRLSVSRLWEHIDHPPGEESALAAKIVEGYDLSRLPESSLSRAVLLFERGEETDPMLAAAGRLATLDRPADVDHDRAALEEAAHSAVAAGRADAALAIWQGVPVNSPLKPQAAVQIADLLLWRTGDFAGAVRVLQPLAAAGDAGFARMYGQALILDQKVDQGTKILSSLPPGATADRHAALSGAMARTIEYYITQRDAQAGVAAWERWQALFPADFLEGYSVLLRTRLMEIDGDTGAAAKVAEAFAAAVPNSAYAPQLLDRASRLLATLDPARSNALREILKQKYPEDPLSQ
jgi:PKD repeat protein